MLRLQVNIKNPNYNAAPADVEVRLLRLNSPVVLSMGMTTQGSLSLLPINLLIHNFQLAWGLNPDPNLPFPLRIVRGLAPDFMPYNSL